MEYGDRWVSRLLIIAAPEVQRSVTSRFTRTKDNAPSGIYIWSKLSQRPVAHWCEEHRVTAGLASGANHDFVLLSQVEVRSDGPCAHIHVSLKLCITYVAEMILLAARGDLSLFDLDEVANPAFPGELAAVPQLEIGTNGAAMGDPAIARQRLAHLHIFCQARVLQKAPGANSAATVDRGAPEGMSLKVNHDIAANTLPVSEGDSVRIDKGHAFSEVRIGFHR